MQSCFWQVQTQRAAISRKRPERRRPFPRGPRIPFINHGVRPAPRCPATPSRTAPRARPVRPLNRSFARANARSRSTEPANPRAIDRATDLVPSYFPRADRDATAGVRRRNTGGGGGAQKTGQGNNMSMLRYYTDDSPGLKITPVRARTPSPNRQPSRGSGHFFSDERRGASFFRSFRKASSRLTAFDSP